VPDAPNPTRPNADTYNAAAWLVDRNVANGNGANVAFVVDNEPTTYHELQRQIWRAQNALTELGVRRGERVAMVVNDELAFPAWFLGALRSGVVPVPLSTMLTATELGAIIADAEAGTVVLSSEYAEHLAVIARHSGDVRSAVVLGDIAPSQASIDVRLWPSFTNTAEASVAPTRPDSPAFWLYSSGTTGLPKGVMHRHASLQATAETYGRSILNISSNDRCLSVAKLFFAYGLGNSLTFPLSVGATAILNPKRPTPPDVLRLVAEQKPTLFFAAPGFVAALLDSNPSTSAFASVRATVTAGEALPAPLQQRFSERFGHPVLDGIGTTEALHIFLSNQAGNERAGTSGMAVEGYAIRLISEAGNLVTAPDTPGYLQVSGPSLATGYWCRDAASRAAFQGEWLSTGDVYTVSADGYWTFLGRNNDMIKAGGIWVSPAEVESVLIEHPDVLEAAVVGARDDDGLEVTVAFVIARAGATIDREAIDAHCRSKMAAFKRPKRLIVVDALPKTATGKIQRFELRNQLAAH
jgi:benzoate-CoA ligase family protein